MLLSHLALGKARNVFDAYNVGARGKEQHCNPRNEEDQPSEKFDRGTLHW